MARSSPTFAPPRPWSPSKSSSIPSGASRSKPKPSFPEENLRFAANPLAPLIRAPKIGPMATTHEHRFLKALGLCLLIAGTLDIADALIFYALHGVPPKGLLQFIAGCLIGVSALHGGLLSAALGLAIHYTITLFWA